MKTGGMVIQSSRQAAPYFMLLRNICAVITDLMGGKHTGIGGGMSSQWCLLTR